MSKKLILVEESLKDFSMRDNELEKMRDIYLLEDEDIPKIEDVDIEDEINPDEIDTEIFDKIDVSDMDDENDIIRDEDGEEQIKLQLKNELLKVEPDREPFKFSVKQNPDENIIGIPMAELQDGDLFLFKIKGNPKLQKIYVKDII